MTKKILICLGIIAAMAAVSCIYFSPALEGKVIRQGDIQKYEAMAHEQKTIEAETGEAHVDAVNVQRHAGLSGDRACAGKRVHTGRQRCNAVGVGPRA